MLATHRFAGEAKKAAIMQRDVVGRSPPITHVDTAEEGLLVSLNQRGTVDLPFIASLFFFILLMNIMELISFHDLDGDEDDHPFEARELLGVAEVGLVSTDPAAIDARLREQAGIEIWSGTVAEPGRMALAFTGARGHSLILSPAGRPWLPQGRISEAHPLRARIGEAELVYDGGMLNVSMRR